jgi:imidazolonepropionase-like amidohydrolase
MSTMADVVAGEEMASLIELLKARRIVVEPTLNFYHARLGNVVPDNVWDSTVGLMVRRLNDAGVTLVAGTDGPPARYLIELELYERAGIPSAQVLQIATINAARVMNEDAEYGSIGVGKVADLIIVNGRPAERIADLANVEVVVRAGRVYDVAVLRSGVDDRR